MSLGFGRNKDLPVTYGGHILQYLEEASYNGWRLCSKAGDKPWQSVVHLSQRFDKVVSIVNTFMGRAREMTIPSTKLAILKWKSVIEPQLIFACESSFDTTLGMNAKYDALHAKYLRFCFGLPSHLDRSLISWDAAHLPLTWRRLQLTARFYSHLAVLPDTRVAWHALQDSVDLASTHGIGWYYQLSKLCGKFVTVEGALPVSLPENLQRSMERRLWSELVTKVYSKSLLSGLSWNPPSRTFCIADYTFLSRRNARHISRLRHGVTNVLVCRGAWESLRWEARVCDGCSVPETETHVLVDCTLFHPERENFYLELLAVRPGSSLWSTTRIMKELVSPDRETASIVSRYLGAVWDEIDARFVH